MFLVDCQHVVGFNGDCCCLVFGIVTSVLVEFGYCGMAFSRIWVCCWMKQRQEKLFDE